MAEYMTNVKQPGQDFASSDFTGSANPSGQSFLEAIRKMSDYVDKVIRSALSGSLWRWP